jgi:SNF2 family DNA or RNA helicase
VRSRAGGVEFETIRSICDEARRVIVATATPFENHPLELWTVYELVGHGRLGDQDEFLDRFCRVRYFRDCSFKVDGWRSDARAQEAMVLISRDFLRRSAGDVGLRLPEREETALLLVPLTAAQHLAYQRAGKIRQPLTRHRKQQDASRGVGVSSPLFQEAVKLVAREVGEQRKVVLHTERIADLDALSELLSASGIRHVGIRGVTTRADRGDAVRAFRDDPAVPVLLGSRVLEYGLNLQFASSLVSVGVSYNPARERQREGRLRRIGSPHVSYRHWIVLPDTDQIQRQLATLADKSAGAVHVLGE